MYRTYWPGNDLFLMITKPALIVKWIRSMKLPEWNVNLTCSTGVVATASSAAFRTGRVPTIGLVKIWFHILKPQLYERTSFDGDCCRLQCYRYVTSCILLEGCLRSVLRPWRCGIFLGNRWISTRHGVTRHRTVIVVSLEVFQGPDVFGYGRAFPNLRP
jgi:hypothetical protein